MTRMNSKLSPMVLAFALALALAACSNTDDPLKSSSTAEQTEPSAGQRAKVSSLPIQPDEESGGSICSIEIVKGATVSEVHPDGSVTVDLPASISGWAYPPAGLAKPSDGWLRLLPHDKAISVQEFPLALTIARPDVSKAKGAAVPPLSGYTGVMLANLPAGSYDAQIVFATEGARVTCENARRIIVR